MAVFESPAYFLTECKKIRHRMATGGGVVSSFLLAKLTVETRVYLYMKNITSPSSFYRSPLVSAFFHGGLPITVHPHGNKRKKKILYYSLTKKMHPKDSRFPLQFVPMLDSCSAFMLSSDCPYFYPAINRNVFPFRTLMNIKETMARACCAVFPTLTSSAAVSIVPITLPDRGFPRGTNFRQTVENPFLFFPITDSWSNQHLASH